MQISKVFYFVEERKQDFAMVNVTQKGQATTIKGRLKMRQLNYGPFFSLRHIENCLKA